MRTALVTGASGFIGRALCTELKRRGYHVRALMRHTVTGPWDEEFIADLACDDVNGACQGINVVFHLASLVHALRQKGDMEADYYRLNVSGTEKVAVDARESRVDAFVFFSSVKAVADPGEQCVDEHWQKYPVDPYGKSKRMAEELVCSLNESGISASVVRPALVYGKGVKGNLYRMIDAIGRNKMPNINQRRNKRSMIEVQDLVSLAITMAEDKRAANNVYFATDGEMYSTKRIYDIIAAEMGVRPGIRIPVWVMRVLGIVSGFVDSLFPHLLPVNRELIDRLLGSACYFSDKASRELGWRPESTFESAIHGIVQHYQQSRYTC